MDANQKLLDLLNPKSSTTTFTRFMVEVQGQPKTGKSTLACTASKDCPPPAQWHKDKPVVLSDLLYIQFEPNALLSLKGKGLSVKNVLDWSSPLLTLSELKPAIQALPAAATKYKEGGVRTVVVDTLSSFNRLLLRDIVERPQFAGDMERIRAYGYVDEMHYLLFDMLRLMDLNIIALVHLAAFQPFGEEGGKSELAQKMAATAEKQIDKQEAAAIGGMRVTYVPKMRPKPAGHWADNVDAVLVAKPSRVAVRAGVHETKYQFIAAHSRKFGAGGRWNLDNGVQDSYLRPHLENLYGKDI